MSPRKHLSTSRDPDGARSPRRSRTLLATPVVLIGSLAAASSLPATAVGTDADRGRLDRTAPSCPVVATLPIDPRSPVDDEGLRKAVRDVILSLDEPRAIREALARAIDAELGSSPPFRGDKARRLPEDLARFLASESWRSPSRDLGGGEESIDLAASVLRWKLDAVRATPEIDESIRRAAIAEEMLLLEPALSAGDLLAARSGLDERTRSRLRAALLDWSDRRVARRGDYFHPELLRSSPEAPAALLSRVGDRLAHDPLLATLGAQLSAETRLLGRDESTRRFREWMLSAQVDAAATRIAAVIEESWIDSLSSPASAASTIFAEPTGEGHRHDDPRVGPTLHRPMPEDLASRWMRSRDEAPPKATFEALVRELLAPAEADPEPPSGGSAQRD